MGATHFLAKTLPKIAAEMALLACNLTRVMNIVGIRPLIAAIMALKHLPGSATGPTSPKPF